MGGRFGRFLLIKFPAKKNIGVKGGGGQRKLNQEICIKNREKFRFLTGNNYQNLHLKQ
jgi:hypothetical protein